MFAVLEGYKTYVVAFVAVVGAIAALLTGEASIADTAQVILTSVLGVTIRHGIQTGA